MIFADTSTPLETWSSLAVLCGESSTGFAGALSPGEDFSSPRTTSSPDPPSPFSTPTAGDLGKLCWTSGLRPANVSGFVASVTNISYDIGQNIRYDIAHNIRYDIAQLHIFLSTKI